MKKNLLKNILTALPAVLAIMSGLAKLSASPQVVEGLTKTGVIAYIQYLGIAEIIFAILFLIPQTSKIGFLLLICYFSGALATEISHQGPIVAPIVILTGLFVAAFFKNKEQFV